MFNYCKANYSNLSEILGILPLLLCGKRLEGCWSGVVLKSGSVTLFASQYCTVLCLNGFTGAFASLLAPYHEMTKPGVFCNYSRLPCRNLSLSYTEHSLYCPGLLKSIEWWGLRMQVKKKKERPSQCVFTLFCSKQE